MTATHERQGHREIEPIVRDEVLRLGPEGQLVGILSHPPEGVSAAPSTMRSPAAPRPAFVILNSGVLHRVGPHRLHVHLARRIAATGLAGLRLDLGGIGDSLASSDAASFRESAVADTRAVMTGLGSALGIQRFVLFGVCSGADNSIATALVDERVAGIVLVDPPTYPTRRSQLRHLRTRAAERGSPGEILRWGVRVAERRLRLAITLIGRHTVDDPPSEGRELPPVATHGAQLTTLINRGVRIFSIFSGIHGARYNHVDQLFEVFPALRGRLDHAYFPSTNHTFTELDAQAKLIDAILGWMAKRFG
ncbi:MAG TPA: hypothetical protein VHN14_03540 [Kofleriaceae bacterium]|jgi:hypothetical protein|nr:hypothetical protein [Kofleriaceae bacterium]